MPSFDVVSEISLHEVRNAVDQTNRELAGRFDFQGVQAEVELHDAVIELITESDFQLKQMLEIVKSKLTKRGIDVTCLQIEPADLSGVRAKQRLVLRQGIDQALAKKMTKLIKGSKLKVQSSIQGEKIRVTGKSRDDLQQVMALLKGSDVVDLPLQFDNFRD